MKPKTQIIEEAWQAYRDAAVAATIATRAANTAFTVWYDMEQAAIRAAARAKSKKAGRNHD